MNKQLLITGLALILTSVVAVSKEQTERSMVDMAKMEPPADASWVEIGRFLKLSATRLMNRRLAIITQRLLF